MIMYLLSTICGRMIRRKYKKTTKEVANSCNISRSAISMYENGKRIPRDDIKIKLANYYNVSIEEIFYPIQPQNEAKEMENVKSI